MALTPDYDPLRKFKKIILIIIAAVIFLIVFSVTNTHRDRDRVFEISTIEMCEYEQVRILGNRLFVALSEENRESRIRQFDVSIDGMIATLSFDARSELRIVNVYDKYGQFLYGFRFFARENPFVDWNGDILKVYTSGLVMVINDVSESVELRRHNDASFTAFSNVSRLNTKSINGVTYRLRSGVIERTDAYGETVVVIS